MTREELIRMATQAGWEMPTQWDSDDGFLVRLERFADLVAAAEREACARVCDQRAKDYGYETDFYAHEHVSEALQCAALIRARSEQ